MKRRIISMILAAVLLVCLAPAAFAASGTCGSGVRWSYDADTGALVISGSGEMYDYGDMVSAPWNEYTDSITSITVESGVTSIGAGAFSKCSAATELTMADTVRKIGSWAFHYCVSLESLDISAAVTEIGSWAFSLCRAAESVTLPRGLTAIGTGAFAYCGSLKEIEIPSTVAEIGGWAFSSCFALTSAKLPAGIPAVGNGTFANCGALTQVTIPASVTVIGSSAFCGCGALTDVIYGGSSAGWARVAVGDDNDGLEGAAVRCTGSPADDPVPAPDPEPAPDPDPELTEPFDDVSDDDWFSDAVKFVYNNRIMDGVTDTTFVPSGTTNRAMIVVILWRLDGAPAGGGSSGFTDVPAGQWYSEAVAWAVRTGVVDGYDDGTFRPLTQITREQVAALLYRFARYQGEDVSDSADLSGFPDSGSVSAYAQTAVRWAVSRGILGGTTGGNLDPKGTANRGQLAVMLMRFSSKG